MKKILFNIFVMGIFTLYSISPLWAALTPEEYSLIINLAGRQRMLSQKMVKETLLIYAGVEVEKNRENLRETVELFRRTLDGLRDGDSSLGLPKSQKGSAKAQLEVVNLLFKETEPILDKIIKGEVSSFDAMAELAEKNPLLLENIDMAVQMYVLESRNVIAGNKAFLGIEINLAGKQRMLSQKMAKEALLIYLDIDRRNNKKLLRQTSYLFDKTLKGLKSGDGDLDLPQAEERDILGQLDKTIEIWNQLSPIIEKSCDIMVDKISRTELESLAALNVLILDEMDKVVKMYEGLAVK